jgi:hypothetical protein
MNKNRLNTFAYVIGYIFAAIVGICLISIAVGLTLKFLFWLF